MARCQPRPRSGKTKTRSARRNGRRDDQRTDQPRVLGQIQIADGAKLNSPEQRRTAMSKMMSPKADAQIQPGTKLDDAQEKELWNFICLEAQYADESRYDEWEALWSNAHDATYWIPIGPDRLDPQRQSSIIFDNRGRLATRIRQLKTGVRYAQVPVSPMRRLISNMVA